MGNINYVINKKCLYCEDDVIYVGKYVFIK